MKAQHENAAALEPLTIGSSGLMVHGGKDTVVPADSVSRLVQKLSQQRGIKIDLEVVPEADHFFTGCLDQLVAAIDGYLDRALQAVPEKAVASAR